MDDRRRLDRRIGLVLNVGTVVAVALLAAGVVLLLAAGVSPLEGGDALDPGRLLPDVLALRPAGFLWLGILVGVATPTVRVAAALVAFVRAGERGMALTAAAILAIIGLSILIAVVSEA